MNAVTVVGAMAFDGEALVGNPIKSVATLLALEAANDMLFIARLDVAERVMGRMKTRPMGEGAVGWGLLLRGRRCDKREHTPRLRAQGKRQQQQEMDSTWTSHTLHEGNTLVAMVGMDELITPLPLVVLMTGKLACWDLT